MLGLFSSCLLTLCLLALRLLVLYLFHYVCLRYAYLRYTYLLYTSLPYASLRYAYLVYTPMRYACLRYAYLRYAYLLHTSLRYSSLRYDYSQNQLVAIQLWHETFIIAMILFQLLSIEVSHRYTTIHTSCDGICPHFFMSFLEECSEKTDKRRSFKYNGCFLCWFFFYTESN